MATAQKVAGFKGLLKLLRDDYGYEGGDTVDEVLAYAGEIELNVGTKASLIRAHKEYMRANVEANEAGGLSIELEPELEASEDEPDEQKMDDEDKPADEKAAKYRAANEKARTEKRLRELEDKIRNGGGVSSVKLPGQKSWEMAKARGKAGLADAESAYIMGNMVLAQLGDKAPERAEKARKELKAWGQKTNTTLNVPDGSALVDTELQRQIWHYPNAFGIVRDYAEVVPMNSADGSIPKGSTDDGGGYVGYWNVEGNAPTLSDLTFANIHLYARELAVLGKISRALMDDSVINLGEYAAQRISEIIHKKIDDAAFNGTGTSAYGGINGILNQFGTAATTDSRSVTGGGTATATTEANVRSVVSKLPSKYVSGAAWYGHRAQIVNIIDRLAASIAGGMTYKEAQGEGLSPFFLGFPVVEVEVMPSAEDASGDQVDLLFGNLAAACAMGSRQDLSIEFNQHRYWDEGNIGVRGSTRVAINVHELGSTTEGSPLVALFQT